MIFRFAFIGGVHGSGKTTIATKAALVLGANIKSCSQIIREERKMIAVTTPGVEAVEANQNSLIAGIKKLRGSATTILLDGHFTLRTSNDFIHPVGLSVFDAMLPDSIFLVETSASVVSNRLSMRDGLSISEPVIRKHQDAERQFASTVCDHLKLNLIIINGDDDSSYMALVNAIL